MSIKFINEPNVLMEAIELIYKYVKGISFDALEQRILSRYNERFDDQKRGLMHEYVASLIGISKDLCSHIDPRDEVIKRFFERYTADTNFTEICLAKVMTYAFTNIEITDFDESIDYIKARFRYIMESEYSFYRIGHLGFIEYAKIPDKSPKKALRDQVDLLDIPGQYKWDILMAFSDFDRELDKLGDIVRPVADRLIERLGVLDEAVIKRTEFWRDYFSKTTIAQLIASQGGDESEFVGRDMLVTFWRIPCDYITADALADNDRIICLYIGMLVEPDIVSDSKNLGIDMIQSTLHILGNKKRLEILHLLKHKRLFGYEIASIVGLDATTVSRHMSALSKCGMVTAEKGEGHIIYYTADKNNIKRFFNTVYRILIDE